MFRLVLLTTQQAGQSGVGSPVGAWDLSLRHNVQTTSGVHPASHSVGTGVLSWTHNDWALS